MTYSDIFPLYSFCCLLSLIDFHHWEGDLSASLCRWGGRPQSHDFVNNTSSLMISIWPLLNFSQAFLKKRILCINSWWRLSASSKCLLKSIEKKWHQVPKCRSTLSWLIDILKLNICFTLSWQKKKSSFDSKSRIVYNNRPQEIPWYFMCGVEWYVLSFFILWSCKLQPACQIWPASYFWI